MTPMQTRGLKLYLYFRDEKMSTWALLKFNAKLYMGLLILYSLIAVIFYFSIAWQLSVLVGFGFIVIVARDIGYYRRSALIWPALKEVIDWEKLEEKLNQAEAGKA